MAREARSRFAILGMLTLGPMSGYLLRQKVRESIGHFWQESFGQLYPALARLEEEGLISGEETADGQRNRRVFSLTSQGRRALHEWLMKSPAPHVERNELLLKLFFGDEVSSEVSIGHLSESREDAARRLSAVKKMSLSLSEELSEHQGFDFYWATLRSGELGLEAHIRFCDEMLLRLRNRGTEGRGSCQSERRGL